MDIGVPHSLQNFDSLRLSDPHLTHFMLGPLAM